MDIEFNQATFVKEISNLSESTDKTPETPNNTPETTSPDSASKPEVKPKCPEKTRQKVAKKVYIDKIIEIELAAGKCKKEDLANYKKRLGRKTIADLEEQLAELTQEMTIALQKVEVSEAAEELGKQASKDESKNESGEPQPKEESSYQMPSERMVDLLFSINIVAAKSVEELSVLGKKHYPDIIKADCVGYSDILVRENQAALREALKGVVADHREILDKYMTPLMVLLVINYLSINQAFIKNLQKKEQN